MRFRRLLLLLVVASLVCLVQVTPVHAEVTTCINGLQGWWSVGDTLQFVGDCNGQTYNQGCHTACECFRCGYDTCFLFRPVAGVDLSNCTIDSAGDKYGVQAEYCFLLGTTQPGRCGDCETNNYCQSVWIVTNYNSAPGDATEGCYTLLLLCDPSASCIATSPDVMCYP